MPVLVVIEVPGGSAELDDALTEAWGTASSPPDTGAGQPVVSFWEIRKIHRLT